VLATFTATGQPPPPAELERLARAHGGQPSSVLAELAGTWVLLHADGGRSLPGAGEAIGLAMV
jgi:hypothetical protein